MSKKYEILIALIYCLFWIIIAPIIINILGAYILNKNMSTKQNILLFTIIIIIMCIIWIISTLLVIGI